jgi:hypothetical protein
MAEIPCKARSLGGLCGKPAKHRLTVMCIHEHVRDGFVCTEHMQDWERGHRPFCKECMTGPMPHPCPLETRVKPR